MHHAPSPSAMATPSTMTDFETALTAVLPVETATEPEPEPVHFPFMCRYTSKRCFSDRAVKRNGKLHNLCELHRRNANNNQRRLELRRRLQDARNASNRVGTPRTLKLKPRPSRAAVTERPYQAHSRKWKPAAAMTVEDMARILAEDADGLTPGIWVPSEHSPLLDDDSMSSGATSYASDTDTSDGASSASPTPQFCGWEPLTWGPRHSLDICEADADAATWTADVALGMDAFASASWATAASQPSEMTSGWANDDVALYPTAPTFIL